MINVYNLNENLIHSGTGRTQGIQEDKKPKDIHKI